MADRRKHSKIDKLPDEIRQQVNQKLTQAGYTFEQIEEWLADQGYEISKSSVHRYHSDLSRKLANMREASEKASAVLQEIKDGLEIDQALCDVMAADLLTLLCNRDTSKDGELNIAQLATAASRLARARTRIEEEKRAKAKAAADKKVEQIGKDKNIHPDVLRTIKEAYELA